MKTLIFALLAVVLFSFTAQAQSWDYFFKPRPAALSYIVNEPIAPVWDFKPTLHIAATKLYQGDGKLQSGFLDAAGPALTLQHSYQQNGLNYSDYSFSLALLMTGGSTNDPSFEPAAALMGGFFNNIVQIGPGYEFRTVPGRSQWFFLFSLGINLFNN